MSDPTTPDRAIGGLPPRRPRPDVSSLVARNRAAAPAPAPAQQPEDVAQAIVTPASTKKTSTRPKAAQRPSRAATPATEAGEKGKMSVEVDGDVLAQARAAFRAAGYFDNVPSFAKFVEGALQRENQRIADAHNNGEPFEPITEKLAPGRKPGS